MRHEIGDWADQFIGSAPATTMIYGVASYFAGFRGDHDEALRQAETGLAVATTGTDPGMWVCWEMAEWSYWYSGRAADAMAAARAAYDAVDHEREPFVAAHIAVGAVVQSCVADRGAADGYLDRLRQVAAALRNPAVDFMLHWTSATVDLVDGRHDEARRQLRLALALAEQIDSRAMDAQTRSSLAYLAMAADPVTANVDFNDALTHLYANRDWGNLWTSFEALAIHWTTMGRSEPAATILGYLEARNLCSVSFLERRRDALAVLREVPEAEWWVARGETLDRDQLVDYVLNELAEAIDADP
jgi:hypothetical protein